MAEDNYGDGHGRSDRIIRFLADEFDGVVLLLGVALVGLANLIGKLEGLRNAALVAIFLALSLRVFRIKYQLADLFTKEARRSESIQEGIQSFRDLLEAHGLHEGEMCDRAGFYRHMLAALQDARKTVDVTQLDSQPPPHYGTPEMVEYFDLHTQRVRDNPNIKFRRIMAIPTLEKLEWLIDILDRVKDCANFQINVIDIGQSSALPPPLSLQIYDHEEMCLIDPTLGFILPEDQQHMLWVRGHGICQVFSIYYDSLWGLAQRIKEGDIIYWEVLEEIAKNLSIRFPEKRALSRSINARMRVLSGRVHSN